MDIIILFLWDVSFALHYSDTNETAHLIKSPPSKILLVYIRYLENEVIVFYAVFCIMTVYFTALQHTSVRIPIYLRGMSREDYVLFRFLKISHSKTTAEGSVSIATARKKYTILLFNRYFRSYVHKVIQSNVSSCKINIFIHNNQLRYLGLAIVYNLSLSTVR